jgi:hypothetical protein
MEPFAHQFTYYVDRRAQLTQGRYFTNSEICSVRVSAV